MTKGININCKILKWARETAGYSAEEESLLYPKFSDWELGKSYPTYYQLEALAKRYNRPLAIFLFPELPKEVTIEKSLRALSKEDLHNINPRVRYLFRKAKVFQMYLKELFSDNYVDQAKKVNWLKNHKNKPVDKLANDIRRILNVSLEEQETWKNPEQALEGWRNILAINGIYIYKECFKDNRVSGFCIYDDIFPIIFLNSSLTKNRQIFTVFHELAHLIFRQNYLDVFDGNFWKLEYENPSHIEVKCNAFAANFLVPNSDFLNRLPSHTIDNIKISELADFYNVSREVILRKLLTLNIVKEDFYEKKMIELEQNYRKKADDEKNSNKKSGGSYYLTQLTYLGRPYFSLVFQRYHQGKINIERASEYLNIKIKSFPGLEEAYLKKGIANVRI